MRVFIPGFTARIIAIGIVIPITYVAIYAILRLNHTLIRFEHGSDADGHSIRGGNMIVPGGWVSSIAMHSRTDDAWNPDRTGRPIWYLYWPLIQMEMRCWNYYEWRDLAQLDPEGFGLSWDPF